MKSEVDALKAENSALRKQMDAQKDEWLSWESKRKQLEKDSEVLNWLQENTSKNVICVGKTWYARKGYGQPHVKHSNIRSAVEYAMKGNYQAWCDINERMNNEEY